MKEKVREHLERKIGEMRKRIETDLELGMTCWTLETALDKAHSSKDIDRALKAQPAGDNVRSLL